ncbi:MAG TPA: LysE family transporter [Thermoplasmata archaeon]|nr:LysE family transporter [Thermoplasmata archaeon]
MSEVTLALFGLGLGFSLTIPPGPMNALIASNATKSFRAGFVTGLGAMSSDAILGTVVYLLQAVVNLHAVARFVYLLGAAVLAFMGIRLLRRAGNPNPPAGVPTASTYATALMVGISNPFQILWWLTAGLAFAYFGGAILLFALFAAIAVWVVAFPSAVRLGTRGSPRAQGAVRYGSGALVLAFAAYCAFLALIVA